MGGLLRRLAAKRIRQAREKIAREKRMAEAAAAAAEVAAAAAAAETGENGTVVGEGDVGLGFGEIEGQLQRTGGFGAGGRGGPAGSETGGSATGTAGVDKAAAQPPGAAGGEQGGGAPSPASQPPAPEDLSIYKDWLEEGDEEAEDGEQGAEERADRHRLRDMVFAKMPAIKKIIEDQPRDLVPFPDGLETCRTIALVVPAKFCE